MFITLEGPEGSGKTSQIQSLATFLREQGYSVLTTREPGGTEISDQIRSVLMAMKNKAMNPRTEILLFCAARAQLIEEVIRPCLERNEIVISDRYADSTLAYQGYGHGTDLTLLRQLLDFATGKLYPDLTVLFDLNPEQGLQRRRTGGGEWNRLDDYALAFHQRVRRGYLALAQAEPARWKILDAGQDMEKVQHDLREVVLKALNR